MTERILIVDDDPQILQGYRRTLGRQFPLDLAGSGREALEQVRNFGPYAVVVSDIRMPGMDGLTLLEHVRLEAPDTVRILLTGYADRETAMEAVNRDQVFRFLSKPCSSDELLKVLQDALAYYRQTQEREATLLRSVAEVRDLEDRLDYQSRHDTLTGLANRKVFEQRLEAALETAQSEGREHALVYIDLDHVHAVNNACGHTAGDELLRQVALLLSNHRRKADLVARLGGDHFALLLEDCSLGRAQGLADGMLQAIRQHSFEWEDLQLALSASIGLIPITRESGGVGALFNAAETACNVAKDSGRSRVHIAGEGDQQLTERLSQAQWIARIQKALVEDRFELYFQMIMPVGPNRETGDHFELLIRMRGEDGTILPPANFLPAAERYHLSSQLDRWVIRTAVNWFKQHPESYQRLSLCSINLSGHSLGDREMLEMIHKTFDAADLPTGKICFEVTETAAISQMNQAVQFIRILKQAGFLFALDDFGSGLSSFGYLRNLPVDFLKIDGMFVKSMDQDAVDFAMVKSINEIGHVMGKKTIAEYVENEEIMKQLQHLGVDYVQGYAIGRPRPLDELVR